MANNQLLITIEKFFAQSRRTYGTPRIYTVLRDQGIRCGCKRVARLMRQAGLQVRRKRSDKVTTQTNHLYQFGLGCLHIRKIVPLDIL